LLISSFAFFERAIALLVTLLKERKRAIAHLLFCKESRKERSLIRSFAKSNKKSGRSFALFKRAEMSDEQMSELAITQPCIKGNKSNSCKQAPPQDPFILYLKE